MPKKQHKRMTTEQQKLLDFYDERAFHILTAVGAVWFLYRMRRWKELEEYGLPRSRETLLDRFEQRIVRYARYLRHREKIALIKAVPEVLDAAITLNGEYIELMERIGFVDGRIYRVPCRHARR